MLGKFNVANPTGRYVLNLGQIADYAIAVQLLTSWNVEVQVAECP